MELARALNMQLNSIKRQGTRDALSEKNLTSDTDQNIGKRSNEIIAERNGMSVKTVQRHIALTRLTPALQEYVDGDKKIKLPFTAAADCLSYIKPKNQNFIAVAIEAQQSASSGAQAQRICGHSMRPSHTKNAAFHCWFTRSAPDIACHRLRIPSRQLEDVVCETVIQQAKIVPNLDQDDMRNYRSKRLLESEQRLQEIQNEKQRLYENLMLGDIQPEEYKERKKTLDVALVWQRDVHVVICEQEEKMPPARPQSKRRGRRWAQMNLGRSSPAY
jgi:hypothetical protein